MAGIVEPDEAEGGVGHPLRHPVRLVTLAGAAGVVVGVFGPWAEGTIADGRQASLNGFSGAADGVFQLLLVAALVLLLRSPAAGASQTLAVQLLPALAGLACLAYAVIAVRTFDQLQLALSEQGATPVMGWGLPLDVLAALVTAIGAGATTVHIMGTHPRPRRTAAEPSVIDRAAAWSVVVVLAAIVLGATVGLAAGLLVLGGTENAAIVFFVGGGAAAGWLASDTVRRMARDWGSSDER